MTEETTIGTRFVFDTEILTTSTEIVCANILNVEAGTNGLKGGDSGHGSRTYIRIEDLGGGDISANLIRNQYGDVRGVEISLGGDSELETMADAAKFIAEILQGGIDGSFE